MTLVAVDAVVDIAANALVVLVGLRLRMAVRALENGVIVWIRVAGRAHSICSAVVDGEVGVIPVCRDPRCRVVAGGAGRWESCRRVVWICRAIVIGLVARVAVRWQRRVIVVDVATGARNG